MFNLVTILLGFLGLAFTPFVFAELRVAGVFSDQAVLQRDMDVPIWGLAKQGAHVTVDFAGQNKSTVANDDGRWQVMLEPMSASFSPREMTISSEDEQLVLKDILVGEVWVTAGQSNMAWRIDKAPEVKKLVPLAKNIRQLSMRKRIALEEQDLIDRQWTDEILKNAVPLSFAYHLEQMTDAPIGIIQTTWGGSMIEAWMPRSISEDLCYFREMLNEFDANKEVLRRIDEVIQSSPSDNISTRGLQHLPSILYNAMMHPIIPYAVRGVAWYQGESNTASIEAMQYYDELLKHWIAEYRARWGRDDLHFMVVGLPGFGRVLESGVEDIDHPQAHSWAWIRESQETALDLSNTSFLNTIDLGELDNIHPADKLPIGQRLALLAARDTLGQSVEAEGPVMQRVEKQGNHLLAFFEHADGLQTTDGLAPKGFWISADEQQWFPANTQLQGKTVILSSEQVVDPAFVRYAFTAMPEVNLVNISGLPARPFRTDSFAP